MIKLALMCLLVIPCAFGATSYSRVENVVCGEFDPFVLGDACLIVATNSKNTNLYISKMSDYASSSLQVREGDFISITESTSQIVTDLKVRVLSLKLTKNLPFHMSEIFFLNYQDKDASLSSLSDVKTIRCGNDHFIDRDGYMHGKINFKSQLHFFQKESYALKQTSLSYELSMKEDFSETWAKGSFQGGNFFNRYNYRPYVYKNYIKFGSLFSDKVFGTIDVLIAKKDLNKESFDAIVILSNMDDHFGTTVEVSCQSN